MPWLYHAESREIIGEVTQDQVQSLRDLLEEEDLEDQDYYIDASTLDMLEERGCDEGLIAMLRHALGSEEGIDVAWSAARPPG